MAINTGGQIKMAKKDGRNIHEEMFDDMKIGNRIALTWLIKEQDFEKGDANHFTKGIIIKKDNEIAVMKCDGIDYVAIIERGDTFIRLYPQPKYVPESNSILDYGSMFDRVVKGQRIAIEWLIKSSDVNDKDWEPLTRGQVFYKDEKAMNMKCDDSNYVITIMRGMPFLFIGNADTIDSADIEKDNAMSWKLLAIQFKAELDLKQDTINKLELEMKMADLNIKAERDKLEAIKNIVDPNPEC